MISGGVEYLLLNLWLLVGQVAGLEQITFLNKIKIEGHKAPQPILFTFMVAFF